MLLGGRNCNPCRLCGCNTTDLWRLSSCGADWTLELLILLRVGLRAGLRLRLICGYCGARLRAGCILVLGLGRTGAIWKFCRSSKGAFRPSNELGRRCLLLILSPWA